MNPKSIVLVASALLLSVTSPAAIAQDLGPGAEGQQPPPAPVQQDSPLSQLNLSPEQWAQLENIKTLTRAQIKEILTPQQWEQLQALKVAGATNPSLSRLDLSPTQKSQLKQIERIANQRLVSILTPQQQRQLSTLGTAQPESEVPLAQSAPAPSVSAPTRKQLLALTTPLSAQTSDRLSQLNLTPQQQAQIFNIQLMAQAEIRRILTFTQQRQLQAQTPVGSSATAQSPLDLSPAQLSQLQQVQDLAQERLQAILTAPQRQQLSILTQASAPLVAPESPSGPAPISNGNGALASNPSPKASPSLSLALGTQGTSASQSKLLSQLELTPEQSTQLQAVRTLAQAQVRSILTPAQWSQLQLGTTTTNSRAALPTLNLTPTQRSQLQEVEQLVTLRLQSILSPAQQQRLQELSQVAQP